MSGKVVQPIRENCRPTKFECRYSLLHLHYSSGKFIPSPISSIGVTFKGEPLWGMELNAYGAYQLMVLIFIIQLP